MYLVKTPRLIPWLYPSYLWNVAEPSSPPTIYLTFDDGPIPEVTPWVLAQLSQYDALATFFCVGDNVRKHPHVYERLLLEGHRVGNHTFNHLNGWQTPTTRYLDNIQQGAEWITSDLFRPPYGRIRRRQAQVIQQQYKIVMWDILSGDFDQQISSQQVLENILKYASHGAIVVLHDSLKAQAHLEYVLPRVLKTLTERGFAFRAIP